MKKTTQLLAFVVLGCGSQLVADVILAPKSSWEYSLNGGGTWQVGLAPFGNQSGGNPDFIYNTYWAADTDIVVRTQIDLTGYNLNTIGWDLGVDNGFDLYANGNFVAGFNHEGYTSRWEYSGLFSSSVLNS